VIIELVYTKDHFKEMKKGINNPVEGYEFEVVDSFDRGEVRGGFYYFAYKDNPEKNRLVVMPLKDILKRKPAYASVEFWGGEKDKWEKGKKSAPSMSMAGLKRCAIKPLSVPPTDQSQSTARR
jgi:recombination protein RecT